MRTLLKQLGAGISPTDLLRYQQSVNWSDGSFSNLEETKLNIELRKMPSIFYRQFFNRKERTPKSPLPVQPFDAKQFFQSDGSPRFIWYGHSCILARVQGVTVFIDAMMGPSASPLASLGIRRFSENTLEIIDHLPEIDLMLISHDHYDHLDYHSIRRLKSKVRKYYVALGVKRHLASWDIDPNNIEEFDWWDQQNFQSLDIIFTPTRHFSGRGLTDRLKSLWGGWIIKSDVHNIWFSGDSGYGNHFAEIGKRHGPFDIGFMESGQYNFDWHQIHLFPHESVKAALNAGAKKVMPVHWGAFDLSYQHTWTEPAEKFVEAAAEHMLPFILPPLGATFSIESAYQEPWWKH